MDQQTKEDIKRILIRLEDARTEVQHLSSRAEYPSTAKFERAYDALETAEKYLAGLIED